MEVLDYINKYGEMWCISAIVEGSIGYYTPEEAKRLIQEYMSGKRKCYSERCMACFGEDLERMLLHDFKWFEVLERRGETAPIINKVKVWMEAERNMSDIESIQVGLMYPTL